MGNRKRGEADSGSLGHTGAIHTSDRLADVDQLLTARAALALAIPGPGGPRVSQLPAGEIAQAARREQIAAEVAAGAHLIGREDVAELLADDVRRLTLNGMARLATTMRLVGALQAAGVDCLTMKGLGLAAQTRNAPLARPSGDIDLLVRPQQLARTHEVLLDVGARLNPRFPVPDGSLVFAAYRGARHEATFMLDGMKLDLHWHLGPERRYLPSTSDVMRGAVTVHVKGHSLRTLSIEHAVIHSALHWRGAMYKRLKYVVDLARLAEQLPPETELAPAVWHELDIATAMVASDESFRPAGQARIRGYQRAVAEVARLTSDQPEVQDLRVRLGSLREQFAYGVSVRDSPRVVVAAMIGPVTRAYQGLRPGAADG